MKFSKKFKEAYEARDQEAFRDLIDDDFIFSQHNSGETLNKEDMLVIWASVEPRPAIDEDRILYENDDILVLHQKMYFISGEYTSAMIVMLLKDGKLVRMEMDASPLRR